MSRWLGCIAWGVLLGGSNFAQAGLHYSGEVIAELPSQWRGFLNDVRSLRSIAAKPTANMPASPIRLDYEKEARKLQDTAKTRKLTSDEAADLGAIWLRLGEVDKALEVLREAERENPKHYHTVANLGTAWQMYGDLARAADYLAEAVVLSPGKFQRAEQLHLKLVRARLREPQGTQLLDDLFGVSYVGPSGKFEPGLLAPARRKELTAEAVALTQQMLIWLPLDGRLWWQLGELANAHADLRIANEIFESCVSQFGLTTPMLREHRLAVQAALAEQAKRDAQAGTAKEQHQTTHTGTMTPKSRRPLSGRRFDIAAMPAIDKTGVNPLPWALLQDTQLDRNFRPSFPKYLQDLNSCSITINGFLQPVTDDAESNIVMLIEYPTGCWYCEMPDVTGIVLVELPEGKTFEFTRNMVKVNGKLVLNSTDPENFLFTVTNAKIVASD